MARAPRHRAKATAQRKHSERAARSRPPDDGDECLTGRPSPSCWGSRPRGSASSAARTGCRTPFEVGGDGSAARTLSRIAGGASVKARGGSVGLAVDRGTCRGPLNGFDALHGAGLVGLGLAGGDDLAVAGVAFVGMRTRPRCGGRACRWVVPELRPFDHVASPGHRYRGAVGGRGSAGRRRPAAPDR